MTRRREGVGAFRGPMTFVGTVLLLVVCHRWHRGATRDTGWRSSVPPLPGQR